MVILITGATHVGKTMLAQKLMEKHKIPYVSQDHIKMGLIRSGYTALSPESPDVSMTEYLWPITREMIKTVIENKQNLIIEGCYFPFDWNKNFEEEYLSQIEYRCIYFDEKYIEANYAEIMKYENCIENRLDTDYCTKNLLIEENARYRKGCMEHDLSCVVIDENYEKAMHDILESIRVQPGNQA